MIDAKKDVLEAVEILLDAFGDFIVAYCSPKPQKSGKAENVSSKKKKRNLNARQEILAILRRGKARGPESSMANADIQEQMTSTANISGSTKKAEDDGLLESCIKSVGGRRRKCYYLRSDR